jgi:curved DNA-binding protein CbpA
MSQNNNYKELDLYSILEIDKNSSKFEIRKSYKKLILKYHPDKNNVINNTKVDYEKFIKIRYAYEILIDDEKRKDYDNKEYNKKYNIYNETYNDIIDKIYHYFNKNDFNNNKNIKNIINVIKNKINNIDIIQKYLFFIDFNLLDINININYSLKELYFNKNKIIKINKVSTVEIIKKKINPFIYKFNNCILNYKYKKEGELISFLETNIYGDLNININIQKNNYHNIEYNLLNKDIYTTFNSKNIRYNFINFKFLDDNNYSFDINTLNKDKTDFGDLYYINNMGLLINDDINFSSSDYNSDSKKIITNTINRGKLFFIII